MARSSVSTMRDHLCGIQRIGIRWRFSDVIIQGWTWTHLGPIHQVSFSNDPFFCYRIHELSTGGNAVWSVNTDEIVSIQIVEPPPNATSYRHYLRDHDVTIHHQPIQVL